MKTHTITTYSFSELSLEAQQNAIDNFIQSKREYFWGNEGIQSIKEGLEFFGAKLADYLVGPYSHSYANFYYPENKDISGMRLRTYLQNNFYGAFFTRNAQGEYKKRGEKWAYKRYSKIQYKKTECPFTGYCVDESFMLPMWQFLARPTDISLVDLLGECVNSAISDIVLDMEYQDSEEFARNELLNGEYEFTENGNIY